MMRALAALGGVLLAWSCGSVPPSGANQTGARLNGFWSATLTAASQRDSVVGIFAFVPGVGADAAYGTFEMDFAALGFRTATPPSVVVRAASPDTVEIAANGRSASAVHMIGVLRDDTIAGVWSVDLGRASGRSGRFVMLRRHQ